ncbi:hypothetical protein AM1_1306 [Acaryochloris marina MBIC11017]|uniref:Uncharacterized protein n=1 Tax=Acaryochloris marina (strain MBIC 11017) TaxID=329726 RepID=B0C5A0_ACAM1|nr:hypothetical protein AM1_1306 [Acaryochloris marina MBIC11017]
MTATPVNPYLIAEIRDGFRVHGDSFTSQLYEFGLTNNVAD